jgi:hypothetical protein
MAALYALDGLSAPCGVRLALRREYERAPFQVEAEANVSAWRSATQSATRLLTGRCWRLAG